MTPTEHYDGDEIDLTRAELREATAAHILIGMELTVSDNEKLRRTAHIIVDSVLYHSGNGDYGRQVSP